MAMWMPWPGFWKTWHTEEVQERSWQAGLKLGNEQMREIAANVMDAIRQFNLREGLRPEDDYRPRRFHEEAITSYKVIRAEDMKVLLEDYCRHRG